MKPLILILAKTGYCKSLKSEEKSFIQGAVVYSANMLQCSDSLCNNNAISVDCVEPGSIVQYVCKIENSITLKWNISSSEDRVFLNTDPIGQTLVADNKFFFTLIDNMGPLVSSLSFNVTENLNRTKIFCVDQNNNANEIELIIISSNDTQPKTIPVSMTYDCDNNMVIVTWEEIISVCPLSHYQLTMTDNDLETDTINTIMTSASFNVSAGSISVTVRGIDQEGKASHVSDPVSFYVEVPMVTNVTSTAVETRCFVHLNWIRDTSNRPPTKNYNVTWTYENGTSLTKITEELFDYLAIESCNMTDVEVIVLAMNCIGSTVIYNETINVTCITCTIEPTERGDDNFFLIIIIIILVVILVGIVIASLMCIIVLLVRLKKKRNPNATQDQGSMALQDKPKSKY